MSTTYPTKDLICIIEHNKAVHSADNLHALIYAAKRNKILLHILRLANINSKLRQVEEAKLAGIIRLVGEVGRSLQDLEYAFIKLIKPVTYAPSDVDILIKIEDYNSIAKRLRKIGCKLLLIEPYNAIFQKNGINIDIYVHPSIGGRAIYLDGRKLLDHVGEAVFHGNRIPALKPYAEIVLVAAHAAYKEMFYTLNDYFTTKTWIDKKSFKLAEELYITDSLKTSLKLNMSIKKGLTEAPIRLSLHQWLKIFAKKVARDPTTRGTALKLLQLSGRDMKLFLERFTRISY